MGWVSQGTGFKELDDFTFSLEPDVVGGPVESPAGWHLVKVLDVLDARYENIEAAETRKRTLRRYLKEKKDDYVVELRKNRYEVVVYDDELTRRFQKEADMIAELNKKAAQEGSTTEQRQEELQKYIVVPPTD
jgi:parvulin-like peptidyl-prolyl isomerase